MNIVELKLVYQYTIFPYRIPSFLGGIKDYDIFLNEVLVR